MTYRIALGWLAVVVFGCAPGAHTVEPYASDPARATALQDHARAVCRQAPDVGRAPPSKPFVTDGCSMWLDRDWARECCVQHDVAYWCGGSAGARKQADEDLRRCLDQRAPSWLARLMYWGVRSGGHPLLPSSFRWGFGRSYPSAYDRAPEPETLQSRAGEV